MVSDESRKGNRGKSVHLLNVSAKKFYCPVGGGEVSKINNTKYMIIYFKNNCNTTCMLDYKIKAKREIWIQFIK